MPGIRSTGRLWIMIELAASSYPLSTISTGRSWTWCLTNGKTRLEYWFLAPAGGSSALWSRAFLRARITVIDVTPMFLGVAWRFFADELERVGLRVLYYSDEPFVGEYEVIVSTLSIHHVGGS